MNLQMSPSDSTKSDLFGTKVYEALPAGMSVGNPILPEVQTSRGKVIFIRTVGKKGWQRTVNGKFVPFGIPWEGFDVEGFHDDARFETQNFWAEPISNKLPRIIEMLEKGHDPEKFIINFASAACFTAQTPWRSCAINEMIVNYLKERKDYEGRPGGKRIGIMPADYVEYYPDFIPLIIRNNNFVP
jgi:hypothetical protein